ncbi:MAG: hypothetical protein P1V35_08360 [Planctomycetota bacterium]|nr:hypothetical protein [Planctomycetota bacterium]
MRLFVPLACLLAMASCVAPQASQAEIIPALELRGGASELKQAFNEHSDRPRLVVLAPPSCRRTLTAMGEIRAEIEHLSAGDPVTWLVIWQDDLPGDDARAADLASTALGWERTMYFHDGYGSASRKLARGTVLSGALDRAFLFYPAGLAWEEHPPAPAAWVHCMGRITPEHGHEPEGMAQAMTHRCAKLWE